MSRGGWLGRWRVAAGVLGVVLVACNNDAPAGSEPGAAATVEPIADGADTTVVAAHVAAVQFYDYLPRADTATVRCMNANVLLRLEPATDLLDVDPYDTADLPPGSKRIIGRIVNLGSQVCGRLGLQPDSVTYWWLRRTGNDTVVISNYSKNGTPGGPQAAVEDTLRIFEYDETRGHSKPDSATARWRDSVVTAALPSRLHFASMAPALQTGATALRSWGSCSQGCCTSGGATMLDQ